MNKRTKWILILFVSLAVLAAALQVFLSTPQTIGNLAGVAAADDGRSWVAVNEGGDIRVYLLSAGGAIQHSFSIHRVSGGEVSVIADMAAGEDGSLYIIKHYTNAATGDYLQKQELLVYTPKLLPFGRSRTYRLDEKAEDGMDTSGVRYLTASVSTSLVLTGVTEDERQLMRKTYDIDTLRQSGPPTIKGVRAYPAQTSQGIYTAVACGVDSVYISKTGKVFLSQEGMTSPVQIYPDPTSAVTGYALYLAGAQTGSVTVGEHPGGGIFTLHNDGKISDVREGGQTFGTTAYSGRDILAMSIYGGDPTQQVMVAQNSSTGAFELIMANGNQYGVISYIRKGFLGSGWDILTIGVLYLCGALALAVLVQTVVNMVIGSRTILLKLLVSSVPMILVVLTLFGFYSYRSYNESLTSLYQSKVKDQGELLYALVKSNSFDKITSPDKYVSTEYSYLTATLSHEKSIHTSSAYFTDMRLYTGIGKDAPPLYPFGVHMSASLDDLYRKAALSGQQQSGKISDRYGERIACVTPVGSSSGNVLFLIETSVFTEELTRQTGGFIRNYLLVSLVSVIAAGILLTIIYTRILRPLDSIQSGLEQFSRGNRTVRLKTESNDELADISRVFNKMANDTDMQLYDLKALTETYYRFVPQRIFRLLGKENLGDLELGSAVEGMYNVLSANLYMRQGSMNAEQIQSLTNRFFSIIHGVGDQNDATIVSDSVNLRSLKIICSGADNAVALAMQAIAQIDSYNATCAIADRLDVSFFLHATDICFAVLGDEERYIPAILSSDLDAVLRQCEGLRQISSRLIVTEAAYKSLDTGGYYHRFMGFAVEGEQPAIGLYDFYGSCSPTLIRLLNETRGTFDKAMDLYLQRRYYDAKNLFAIVLRENQYDNVSRHYIFRCERNL